MSDSDTGTWDLDLDDWDEAYWPREEPDCYQCGDTGHVPGRLRRRRNCRDCNPTRWQHRWGLLTWPFRRQVIRGWVRRRSGDVDEAPF